ncbi:hypothetical protein ACWCPM_34140 [Streptomyces sp. NPDC002309]
MVEGIAGVGKTALALRLAHDAAERYPDGQSYADLGGYGAAPRPLLEVLASFLAALGVGPRDIPPDEHCRATLFRTLLSGRRALLLMDNALP